MREMLAKLLQRLRTFQAETLRLLTGSKPSPPEMAPNAWLSNVRKYSNAQRANRFLMRARSAGRSGVDGAHTILG
jgi:hypothetical protein